MSIEKLTADEEEFLREANMCAHCHTDMLSQHYPVAESLEKKRLIRLVSGGTESLRGVYLTKKGKKYAEQLPKESR